MQEKFEQVYKLLRLNLYQQVFKTLSIENTDLSTSEYLCLESIFLLDKPTVSEFANYLGISSSNAAYKVRQLMHKGYIEKVNSKKDARVYSLVPTTKFHEFYKRNSLYVTEIFKTLEKTLGKDEINQLESVFDKVLDTFKK